MRPHRITRLLLSALALLAAVFVVAACGNEDEESSSDSSSGSSTQAEPTAGIQRNEANAKTTLTVGSKNFTEQIVLGEIYAQAFEAAGYGVRKEFNLGDEQTARKSLESGQISGYPEYTGTILLSFLDVKAGDLPSEDADAYDQAKSGLAEDGITALPPTPFTSSNEVGLLKAKADELGVKKISDLEGKDQDLKLYGSPECRTRRDCLLGLQEVYGLDFRRFVPVNIDQRHEVLRKGQADLSIVFTTDPEIKRNEEVLLEDDKGMFPPYNSTFLVTDETAQKAGPDLAKVVEQVNENLTDEVVQELNARVAIDKDTPEQAAEAYLKQYKLIASS